ncbi:hypothetical protein M0804_007209 [Polistes exclamans]|nr:hypothetical protein M0804_007209 [Polistes exclamans]
MNPEKRENQEDGKGWEEEPERRPRRLCASVERRLAICVVFYDNYKYGRKALCLEQLVRLSKLCPSSHGEHGLSCKAI